MKNERQWDTRRGARCLLGAWGLVAALLSMVLSAGCLPSSSFMQPAASPPALSPPAGKALIVFLSPSIPFGALVTIVDEQGRFLGVAQNESYFTVARDPGTHYFFSWSYAGAVWNDETQLEPSTSARRQFFWGPICPPRIGVGKATVEAGRVYFVRLYPLRVYFVELRALTPRSEEWSDREDWLEDAEPLVADVRAGQASLDKILPYVRLRIKRGLARWEAMTAEQRAMFTITEKDGIAQE